MKIELNEVFHPRIVESSIALFENSFFQNAALESMKQVEMALREKGVAPHDLFGDRLVKWVMGSGEHITLSIPLGEEFQEKARMLFRGAFGYYRNYAAHDGAKINKKTCFRIMVLASELLDLVDASKRSFEGIGGIDGLINFGVFKNAKEFQDLLDFLEGQQIRDYDYSEYESDLLYRGFNQTQVETVFDFRFVKIDEWDTGIDLEARSFSSTHIMQINLTDEGVRIWEELNKL